MFRAIKIVGTIVSFLVGSIGTLHRMDKQGQVDPVAVEEESTQMVRNIFEKLLKMAGVTVEVRGYENIPQDRPVLYVGNHRSYFDILVGYTTVPGFVGFVAKKEMEKIPLLRSWMKNVNCLFLDRKDIKAGLKTILEGIEKVKNGISVWIFPEGIPYCSDLLHCSPFGVLFADETTENRKLFWFHGFSFYICHRIRNI